MDIDICKVVVKVEAEFEHVFEMREFLGEVQALAESYKNVKVSFEEL